MVVLIGTALPLARDRLFWPSLLATALVALAVQPVREWAERLAARLVYGRRAAPYVELTQFSKRLQESPWGPSRSSVALPRAWHGPSEHDRPRAVVVDTTDRAHRRAW